MVIVLVTVSFLELGLERFPSSTARGIVALEHFLDIGVVLSAKTIHLVSVPYNAIVAAGFLERGNILGDVIAGEEVDQAVLRRSRKDGLIDPTFASGSYNNDRSSYR